MRNRLILAMVALLLLLPANAFAQETDICYTDPDDPSCVEVIDDESDKVSPEVEDDGEEASVDVLDASADTDATLAETGISATLFSVIAALMLAAGALLLVVSRRRGSAA